MSGLRRTGLAFAVATLLPAMVSPASAVEPDAARHGVPLDQLRVTTAEVATGLVRPVAMTGANDRTGRMLIAEKRGTVRAFHPKDGLAADPVLDISDRVNSTANERGLLGIVPARDFAHTSKVYVAYTRLPDGALTLSRVKLGDPASEQVLLTQDHARFSNHNGGQLAFGHDGYLYWSLGDGGSAGDPDANAMNLGTLLGKILRIDVNRTCGDLPYCVPKSNPFVSTPGARPEIWAHGLRNAWRFSFDALDGSLWIADVGQGAYEEINHAKAFRGGQNYGWSCMEGPAVFNAERCAPGADYKAPVFHYQTRVDGCAVIGGHVYRGHEHARLAFGTYVATDYCSAAAFAIRKNRDGTYTNARIGQFPAQVSTFGVDRAGELYVATDRAGQLFRVGFERVS
ncbi:PQQ-dependent sugar dehydrogenase [Kibdelosporangium phytohabitans]|uniref:Glucose/sorbosone dehydrogenase-like protein n=1 Tax=Kibdelosporangium phytohabitans TaxID=860235 RepID=A0A0N9HVP9_9PSEU|nr:PQQ-dependent sugar dehydrogenase [Kibdelosporangium phytohabitans]ALG09210.1 glucose/sorbosone dehydrogenase-like protein [Kibdelosporangium phytohabitans]MBE1469557.1 glucose/arabinose dehydrogenase [Kibdelosporangium phytohabitans]